MSDNSIIPENSQTNVGKKIKNKKLIMIIVAAVLVVSIVAGIFAFFYIKKLKTPTQNSKGYYELDSVEDLFWFADEVNSGRNTAANAILMSDIDLSGNSWVPIGEYDPSINKVYKGFFDGNGYTVSGINCDMPSRDNVGFFGYSVGTISNLSVDGYINGSSDVGGVVGVNAGTVEKCVNNCIVKGIDSIGGVVGRNAEGTMNSCINNGIVKGNNEVGGIVGDNNSDVDSCTNNGNISGGDSVGGIAGSSLYRGTIKSCTNNNTVSGNSNIGGIAGVIESSINTCENTGDVNGKDKVGGIVGCGFSSELNTCTNSGVVTGNLYVGGVVGYKFKLEISNCSYYQETATCGIGYCSLHCQYDCQYCNGVECK